MQGRMSTLRRFPAISLLAKGAFVAIIGGGSGYVVYVVAGQRDAHVPTTAVAPAAGPSLALPDLAQPASAAQPLLQLPTAAPDLAPRLQLDPRLEEAQDLSAAQALLAAGHAAAAKERAQASLAHYPHGSYTKQLRAIAEAR